MSSIKDVAKHAGVAISTVSKVLNGYPNVSEDTKKRVNDAIRELNYVPNTIAAALSSKQTGRFAILINLNTQTQAIDEINMQYLSGAMNKARELKLDVITIFYSMLQDKSLDEIIVYLKSQSIAGIIIYQMSKDDTVLKELIDSQEFKIVVVDSYIVNENTSSVWVDQARAQYDVAKKAIEGSDVHNILYIAGKENGFVTEERIKGIKQLAKDLKLDLRIEKGEFSELQARNITMQYGKDYDVIVCASDLMAIGAMNALTEMDVYHPVCGFDGITLMGYVGKQMHTVKQNFSHVSGEAVNELRELLSGGVGRNVVLDYELVRLKYEDIIC
ncbi:MAG: LacI family DNA-binding transcriptional regulator [Lachnospiraceae bacterium]|nr:LacI family DNA-binding transcriptional regulator [Lachnospiraceae bacterium]